MRIGLFGGSFNPIHFGHLRAAEEVREALTLEIVYFIPAAAPPHKPHDDLARPDHRLRMAQLGTKGNRHFMVSDAELRRSGPSYTIDTVRHFAETTRGRNELYLLVGGDQFNELETWKDCDELARSCNLVVHSRPSAATAGKISLAALARFGYRKSDDHYVHPSNHTLAFVATTFLPISATLIRAKIRAHESIRYLVPGDVAEYIERHGLY
ncbi:MAG TPA: nicotinate-nucleotide adenylyltransferase [Candidatus Binataceae bacterium]|nr:nicotinate-nucleotide adenylyltransferase [Candidatus Binataceae bacterium]